MIKKAVMIFTGAMLAGLLFAASPADVKAALPCTYDIINDANGNIASATAAYEAAKANEASLLAAFNAIKADPAHSQLQYEKAAYDYNNAVNVTKWCLAQLNNAKVYLNNITDRGAFEDQFADNKAALANITIIKASKFDAEGSQNIANGIAQQIADVQKAIAGYQTMVASNPSLQPQLDTLNARLASLQADYAKQVEDANAKNALFENNLNTLNYQSYDQGFEDYQHNREWQREDPENYDVKNQKWIGSKKPFFNTVKK